MLGGETTTDGLPEDFQINDFLLFKYALISSFDVERRFFLTKIHWLIIAIHLYLET
jgi:hypothetical protein